MSTKSGQLQVTLRDRHEAAVDQHVLHQATRWACQKVPIAREDPKSLGFPQQGCHAAHQRPYLREPIIGRLAASLLALRTPLRHIIPLGRAQILCHAPPDGNPIASAPEWSRRARLLRCASALRVTIPPLRLGVTYMAGSGAARRNFTDIAHAACRLLCGRPRRHRRGCHLT